MKTILAILFIASTSFAASVPPELVLPGMTFPKSPAYSPKDTVRNLAKSKVKAPVYAKFDPKRTVVNRKDPVFSARGFLPSAADGIPRPMTMVLTPTGSGSTSVCVETVQVANETLYVEYAVNLGMWAPFATPIPPNPGGTVNLGVCNTVPTLQLPPQLWIRINNSVPPPPTNFSPADPRRR